MRDKNKKMSIAKTPDKADKVPKVYGKSGKIRKNRTKKKKSASTSVKLPEKMEDFSSNWKQLLSTMEVKPKKKIVKKSPKNLDQKKPDIWFDDVDPDLLDPEDRPDQKEAKQDSKNLVKEKSFSGLTKSLAMDCEMVGIGYEGKDSLLARVSIVNQFGHCVYDKYVKNTEKVTDFRTKVSGIRPEDIKNGEDFKVVQKEVAEMLKDRILVGHSIKHDLKVLFLDHPRSKIRDTSAYKPFRAMNGGKTPSLKNLTARMLGVTVQVNCIYVHD